MEQPLRYTCVAVDTVQRIVAVLEPEQSISADRPVTVLLAEDEFLVRALIADEMRQLGWQVIEVGTADEAVEIVRSPIELDLVLTDVHMPGSLDGLDLADRVREQRPGIKVAVMSGDYDPEPNALA